jgi:hypothetical protein
MTETMAGSRTATANDGTLGERWSEVLIAEHNLIGSLYFTVFKYASVF